MQRLIVFAVVLSAGAAALAQGHGGPPAKRVVVDRARMEMVEPRREVTGELRAVRESTVASKQSGRVVAVEVEEGDSVDAGAALVRLDDALERIEVERALARRQSAQSGVHVAEATLERAQRDAKRIVAVGDAATEKERLDAQSDAQIAQARLAGARADALAALADLEQARQRRADMTIVAPYAGVVTRKRTEVGEWVGAGDATVDLIDLSVVDAWLNVPEMLLPKLQASGATAQVRVRATGRVYEGAISAIVPEADELARLFPVRVRLDNPDGALRPGMSIVGLAPTGERREMLTVHKDAVLVGETGSFVYYDAGGVSAVARVRVLFAVGDRVVVDAPDLPPDAPVVVEGNERLFPGQPIITASREGAPTGREG